MACRLRFRDRVPSAVGRPQIGEHVDPVDVGLGDAVDRLAEVVDPGQRYGHTWDARLAEINLAVVVGVDIHEALNCRWSNNIDTGRSLAALEVAVADIDGADRVRPGSQSGVPESERRRTVG